MTTLIQIGNSDNKLTQQAWSDFVEEVDAIISAEGSGTHFSAASEGSKPWQNYCWVFEWEGTGDLHKRLTACRAAYNQDSVAITTGTTAFI